MAGNFINRHKHSLLHSSYLFFLNLFIISLILYIASALSFLDLDHLLSTNWLSTIVIISITSAITLKYNLNQLDNKNSSLIEEIFIISPYFFLSLLIILFVNQFLKLGFLIDNNFKLVILGIAFGFITFYKNLGKVEQELEDEKQKEDQLEQERKAEFSQKFPRINKIWGLRSIVKWMYKEGWNYSFGLFLIVSIGLWLRLRYLSLLSFWNDEAISIIVSQRINEGLGHTLLSGQEYVRAYLYHSYLAFVLSITDNLIVWSRLANLPFYLASCILVYLLAKRLINKRAGLISTILFTISWFSISMFRDVRFYEMLVTLVLLMSLFLLNFFNIIFSIDRKAYLIGASIKNRKAVMYQNFLFFILFFILAFETNLIAAAIIYPIMLFGLTLYLRNNEKKGLIIFIFTFIGLFLGTWISYLKEGFKFYYIINPPTAPWRAVLLNPTIWDFFVYLIKNSYSYLFLLLPIILFIPFLFRSKKFIYLWSFIIGLYFFISLQLYGIIAIRYYYIMFPFLAIGISLALCSLFSIVKQKKLIPSKLAFYLFVTFIVYLTVYSSIQESSSPLKLNSLNEPRNVNYMQVLKSIEVIRLENNAMLITDNELKIDYLVNVGTIPDYVFRQGEFNLTDIDPHTNSRLIKYYEIHELNRTAIVALFKKRVYFVKEDSRLISGAILDYFNDKGSIVYEDPMIIAYKVN